jgi:hypothetical protein
MTQEIPQSQRCADQEVVSVVIFEVPVSLDPLHHMSDKHSAWLLLVRVIPQHINIFLFACDLDNRLDEHSLAEVNARLCCAPSPGRSFQSGW